MLSLEILDESGQRILVGATSPLVEVIPDEEGGAVAGIDGFTCLHQGIVGGGFDLLAFLRLGLGLAIVLFWIGLN